MIAATRIDEIYDALALKEWELAHRLMAVLVGDFGAARWLSRELERAEVIQPRSMRRQRRARDAA